MFCLIWRSIVLEQEWEFGETNSRQENIFYGSDIGEDIRSTFRTVKQTLPPLEDSSMIIV